MEDKKILEYALLHGIIAAANQYRRDQKFVEGLVLNNLSVKHDSLRSRQENVRREQLGIKEDLHVIENSNRVLREYKDMDVRIKYGSSFFDNMLWICKHELDKSPTLLDIPSQDLTEQLFQFIESTKTRVSKLENFFDGKKIDFQNLKVPQSHEFHYINNVINFISVGEHSSIKEAATANHIEVEELELVIRTYLYFIKLLKQKMRIKVSCKQMIV